MFPNANIPVIQISIDISKPFFRHYELGLELAKFREQGVLLVGSGNLVHNLRLYNWRNPSERLDWAVEADAKFRELIVKRDGAQLSKAHGISHAAELAINSAEHYIPALYSLGFGGKDEKLEFFNDRVDSAISMTSFWIE
ncbi:MAG: dioxygenase [Leptospira sp.]|nr:dioxygenase [Leptospira sp.]